MWLLGCPHGHFFVAAMFLGKAHTLAPTLSRCSACNHLEIAAGDGHDWPLERSIAVGAKRKKCTSTAGRVSRSATAFISAFSAKFGLGVIWLSAVRVAAFRPVSCRGFRRGMHDANGSGGLNEDTAR